MAAVNRPKTSNGYGEKIQITVITVDKVKGRVEGATRDGAMIFVAVWETSTVFRWPEVGEKWTVRKDMGVWRLDQIVQTELAEIESEATPKTLEELPEGDTRIIGNTIHMNDASVERLTTSAIETITVNNVRDWGVVTTLPVTARIGDRCTLKVEAKIYWDLVYTGEETYPWAKVGGSPLRVVDVNIRVCTSTVFLTTGAPTINLPVAMECLITFGCASVNVEINELNSPQVGLFVNGIESETAEFVGSTQFAGSPLMVDSIQAASKGQTVALKYRNTVTTKETQFRKLQFKIDPIRLG